MAVTLAPLGHIQLLAPEPIRVAPETTRLVNMSGDEPGRQSMAKFIQICASQNDLFALDEEGRIHQYNFNTKTWEQLALNRSDEASARSDRRGGGGAWAKKP